MADNRIFNFSAGPSMLPLPVLERAASEMVNYHGSGMSVMEMSHRSKVYDELINNVEASVRRVMNIPDNYAVLFEMGGGTQQFSNIPINLMKTGKADYVVTGHFAKKAAEEAAKFGEVSIAATSEEAGFSYIPKQDQLKLNADADYLYLCANNTIYGTEWKYVPETGAVPIAADMSSNIMSKPVDVSKFGLIFAGAQKNIGPAGVTLVIVREDLLGNARQDMPVLTDYKKIADKKSMYNTPPCYNIYILGLVVDWIENTMGGLEALQKHNQKKAALLYDYLDQSKLFLPVAEKADRSMMNVTFRTGNKDLDAKFAAEGAENGMSNLKGHRSVGGMRASIYNAMPIEGVEKLVAFMEKFEKENG